MIRFTENHMLLSELMNRLIKIYYMHHLFESSDELVLKRPLRLLKKLPKSYQDSFIEDRSLRWGLHELFPGLTIDFDQLRTFQKIMDSLQNAIIKQQYCHFWLYKVEDDVQTYLPTLDKLDEISTKRNQEDREMKLSWADVHKSIHKGAISSLSSQGKSKKAIGGLIISSQCHRTLHVEQISEFAFKMLKSEPYDEPFNRIYPIWFPTWNYFIDAVKSIIVNFHFAFDGFNRLKLCKNCQKLIFEKREGYREFCDVICRRNFHIKAEPRNKRLCRERQNAWIRNRFSGLHQVKSVQRSECEICAQVKESGKCETLINKYSRSLQKIIKNIPVK